MATLSVVPRKGWTRAQKALLLAAAGAGSYALYRYYRSDDESGPRSITERIQQLQRSVLRLPTAVANYYAAYLTMSETAKLISRDLHAFLSSDAEEVPQSLQQCGRLLEAGATLVARGAVQAAPSMSTDSVMAAISQLLETLDSQRGRSLLGFVLERACQESVRTFVEAAVAAGGSSSELNALPLAMLDKYFAWASSPAGEATSVAMVSAFASSGMEAYMRATEGGNFWEDLFSVLAKPEYAAFLGTECEVSTRAFVLSLFEALGRGGRMGSAAAGASAGGNAASTRLGPSAALGTSADARNGRASPAAPPQSSGTGTTPSEQGGLPSAAVVPSGVCEVLGGPESAGSGLDAGLWASAMVQVVKVPEARQLVASLCGSATSAGVRATLFSLRDMIAESPQTFIVLLALVVGLPMYLASRQALQAFP